MFNTFCDSSMPDVTDVLKMALWDKTRLHFIHKFISVDDLCTNMHYVGIRDIISIINIQYVLKHSNVYDAPWLHYAICHQIRQL
jgi:hypothetical protein